MISTPEWHWLAGILEGEGCFGHSPNTAFISIGMTDRDVMERVSRMFGTTLFSTLRPPCKEMFRTKISGHRAAGMMMTVYGLMGARRKAKIRESIAEWKTRLIHQSLRTHCLRGHPLSGPNLYLYPKTGMRACRACRICRTKAAIASQARMAMNPGYVERLNATRRRRYAKKKAEPEKGVA